MPPITAFAIVRNERANLPACLASLRGCVDRVVILDTGSSDGTCELLADLAVRDDLPPLEWDRVPFAGFGPTCQLALDRVRTPWALRIDADERVSEPLRRQLQELRARDAEPRHDAYRVRRRTRILGHAMRQRNLAGERILRLFRVECGRITPTIVHEGVELREGAAVGDLDGWLWHDTMTSWRAYLRKVDQYTTLDARRSDRRGSALHLLTAAPAAFLRDFVGRGGVRDGWPGLVWAATSAWSAWLLDWKLLRRSLRGRRRPG